MKKTSKIFVLLFLMTMLASVTVLAEEDQTKYSAGHFYYHSHDGYVSVCGYLGRETDVVIPASISGRPVSEIEGGSFEGCNTILTITVPDTVVIVHEDSFAGAASLKKIISHATGVEVKAGEGVEVEYASNVQSDAKGNGNEGNSDKKGNEVDGGDATDHGNAADGGNDENKAGTENTAGRENNAGTENTAGKENTAGTENAAGTENTAGTGKDGEGESSDGSDGMKAVQGSDDAGKNEGDNDSDSGSEDGNSTQNDDGQGKAPKENQAMEGEGAGDDSGIGDFAFEEVFLDTNAEAGTLENASDDMGITQEEITKNGMTESSIDLEEMSESKMAEKPDAEQENTGLDGIVLIGLAVFVLVAVIGGIFVWKGMKDINQAR